MAVLGAKRDVKALKGMGVASGESASVQSGTAAAGVAGSSHMVPTLSSEKAFLGVGTGAAVAAGSAGRALPFVGLLAPAAGVEGACMASAAPAVSIATVYKKWSIGLHSLHDPWRSGDNTFLALSFSICEEPYRRCRYIACMVALGRSYTQSSI